MTDPSRERHPPIYAVNAHICRTVRVDLAPLERGPESRSRDLISIVRLVRAFLQPPGRLAQRLFMIEKAKNIEFYRIYKKPHFWAEQ